MKPSKFEDLEDVEEIDYTADDGFSVKEIAAYYRVAGYLDSQNIENVLETREEVIMNSMRNIAGRDEKFSNEFSIFQTKVGKGFFACQFEID